MQWTGIDLVKNADGTTSKMSTLLTNLSTGTILDGAVTNAKLSSTAVTESKTVAGTFTTASLNAAAGILGSQLDSAAGIVGGQLANTTVTAAKIANATITTTQISATAAITGSQLAAAAAIAGTQLASNAAIAGTQLASNAAIAGTQLAANAAIAGTQLAAAANIAGTQLSSSAAIAGTQLGVGCLHQVKTSIGHANGTPTIAVLPAGSILTDVMTVCTEAYNATAPTVNIGYAGSTDVILPTASITKTLDAVSGEDVTTRGTDLFSTNAKRKYYAAQTTVIATIAGASGNTTGTMDVILSYLQTA
jgi:predicted phage tail protein